MSNLKIEQVIDNIFASRKLTRNDQQQLMMMFSQSNLDPKDAMQINRVYDALHQGRLRVVD
jgi:D-arabinose 1-dehydrogenase-like Zn-dependent alcohol dehydrogenase